MLPHDSDVRNLALYAPKIAYGMMAGVPRVPFVNDISVQFSSSVVNAPAVEANFSNNITSDTLIQRVSYSIFAPNSFPGSPFQSTYFNQQKQSGSTGIGVEMTVYGGPKYAVNNTFTDVGNLLDVFALAWPAGWPLYKQSNVKVSAMLLETPVSVPLTLKITFLGVQFLEKSLDDLSDSECRSRLRKLGIETPDLASLFK